MVMGKGRLEAFSDGVLAIIITIMVLELKVPHGDNWAALQPMVPIFLAYVMSFVYVGIYWNNHHHLLHATTKTSGAVLWANLLLLFWLSLFPVTTTWLGEHPSAPAPTLLYGVVLLMAALSYYLLEQCIVRADGEQSHLKRALGNDLKGKISPIAYTIGIALSYVAPHLAQLMYVLVALMWLIPDRRIERDLNHHTE